MSKRMIWALSLIVLCVIIFVLNNGKITVEMGAFNFKAAAAFVFLGFTSVGVVIGTLLR